MYKANMYGVSCFKKYVICQTKTTKRAKPSKVESMD